MCAHVCIVYVCIWSCPCICTCVTVHLCCVLVWELLSDCHGLLTQTLMQQCSLVADLRCIVCVCVCIQPFFCHAQALLSLKLNKSLSSLRREKLV